MVFGWCRLQQSEVVRGILAYLMNHPKSQDTLEGIIWWLLHQEIEEKLKEKVSIISDAVADLVKRDFVEQPIKGLYRINLRKKGEIEVLLGKNGE